MSKAEKMFCDFTHLRMKADQTKIVPLNSNYEWINSTQALMSQINCFHHEIDFNFSAENPFAGFVLARLYSERKELKLNECGEKVSRDVTIVGCSAR